MIFDERMSALIELNKQLNDISSLLETLEYERSRTYGYYSKSGLNNYISKLGSLKSKLKRDIVKIAEEEE